MISMVIPGNPFPITEPPLLSNQKRNPHGFLGKGCRPGYQSHLTFVKSEDISTAYPLDSDDFSQFPKHADELVIFDTSQAVPLFVFYSK